MIKVKFTKGNRKISFEFIQQSHPTLKKLEGRDREFERAKKNSRGKKLEEQNGGGGGGRNGIIVIQLLAGTLWALLTVLLLQWPFLKPV